MLNNIVNPKKLPVRILFVLLGSSLMALSLNMFVEVGGLLPGGFVGLSKLIQRIVLTYTGIEIPYAVLNIAMNAFPAIYAYFHVGHKFVLLSFLSVAFSSFLVDFLPVIPVTHDMILLAIFGGVLNGIGLILILNSDASAGGTDFIAIAISNSKNYPIWNYVLIFNAIILLVSGVIFGLDEALYSIIFQFISVQLVNSGHLRYQRKTAFIITKNAESVAPDLMRMTHHGVTKFKGIGCYSGEERDLLYMVCGRKDLRLIKHYLKKNDPHAFLNMTNSEHMMGLYHLDPMD